MPESPKKTRRDRLPDHSPSVLGFLGWFVGLLYLACLHPVILRRIHRHVQSHPLDSSNFLNVSIRNFWQFDIWCEVCGHVFLDEIPK